MILRKIIICSSIALGALLGAFLLYKHFQYTDKCTAQSAKKYYVDFDVSMQTAAYPELVTTVWSKQVLDITRRLYAKNNLLHAVPARTFKIPAIIHQIWLGSPLPEKYRPFAQSWKRFNPTWQYKLWTEKEVAELNLQEPLATIYKNARNYGEKSDILRYKILHDYGGVYADTDCECLQPFDIFNCRYDFYIGLQPLDTTIVQLGTSLMACAPKHELIANILSSLPSTQHIIPIVAKTGPLFVTRVFCAYALQAPGKVIAFPATYFNPCGYTQKNCSPEQWLKAESFAVHHWEGSWLHPEAFEHA